MQDRHWVGMPPHMRAASLHNRRRKTLSRVYSGEFKWFFTQRTAIPSSLALSKVDVYLSPWGTLTACAVKTHGATLMWTLAVLHSSRLSNSNCHQSEQKGPARAETPAISEGLRPDVVRLSTAQLHMFASFTAQLLIMQRGFCAAQSATPAHAHNK